MKKRIMFLESRYDSFYGAQKSMLKLIKGLKSQRFVSKVVTTEDGELKRNLESCNVKVDVVKLGKSSNVFGGRVLNYSIIKKIVVLFQLIFYNLKLVRYIFHNKIDIIYVNDSRALLYTLLASKILNKKIVWYIRADISNSIITRICLRHSDYIITIANGVLRNLPLKTINKYKIKTTNIYTGFDFDTFNVINKRKAKKMLDIPDNCNVIGYLGSIHQRKGIDTLVDSYINLTKYDKNVFLLIVGNISQGYKKYFDLQLSKLEKEKVPFKYIPYTNKVSEIYSAMDIFVLPSKSEGLPRVIIEAMGHKVPVIVTDVGGTKEIVVNKDYGLFFDVGDSNDLTNKLIELLRDNNYREALSKKGNEFVLERFSDNKFIEEINHFFERI